MKCRPLVIAAVLVMASCRCGSGQAVGVAPPGPAPGCGEAAVVEDGTWHEVQVDGRVRRFMLDVPEVGAGTRLPVVMSFHGIGGDPAMLRQYSGLGVQARGRGFIAVHPQGEIVTLGTRVGPGWSIDAEDNRDVALADAIVGWLQTRYCVDDQRVYAMGFSNGGHLAHVLGCKTTRSLAGIGAVGGALKNMESGCGSTRVVQAVVIHGSDDPVVGVAEGRRAAAFYETRNGCEGPDEKAGACTAYSGCSAPVMYCEVQGLTHSWPRSDMGDAVDGTDVILGFFGL